jgi:hypothetical protein
MAMAGNVNALGLILVILLTGAVLVRYGAWPASIAQVVGGLAAALGLMFAAECMTLVLYDEASHYHQELIPSLCLGLLLVFAKPSRIRRVAVMAAGLSAFVWSFHVLSIVGPSARYTGSPEAARRSCRAIARSHLRIMRSILTVVAQDDNRSYPAGWFTDIPLIEALSAEDRRNLKCPAAEIHPFWHTPLTGLYEKSYHELSLWYPGGRVKDGMKGLAFRLRQK